MLISQTNVSQKFDESYPTNSIDSCELSFLSIRKSTSDLSMVYDDVSGILNRSLIKSILFRTEFIEFHSLSNVITIKFLKFAPCL